VAGEESPDEKKVTAKAGQRLRLSIVDFNASFAKATGKVIDVDTSLLDIFQTTRIDDYTLVNTIFFQSEKSTHDPDPPDWAAKGFGPLGQFTDAARTSYLTRLTTEMHNRGQQVIVGYTLDEGAPVNGVANITAQGKAFRAWLGAATTAQVVAHAQQIVDFFFKTKKILIDGVDFDLEINGLGGNPSHAANLETLFVETAKAIDAARKGASVSYDNAPFTKSDGTGAPGHLNVQKYAIAAGAPNLIARPMHNLDAAASKATISATIALALKSGGGGGGITSDRLQIMLDFGNTGTKTVEDICKTVLFPNKVGLVLYNLGGRSASATSLKSFAKTAQTFDAALSPAAAPPGKKGAPLQAPLGADLP
jgi:hypothetical protein